MLRGLKSQVVDFLILCPTTGYESCQLLLLGSRLDSHVASSLCLVVILTHCDEHAQRRQTLWFCESEPSMPLVRRPVECVAASDWFFLLTQLYLLPGRKKGLDSSRYSWLLRLPPFCDCSGVGEEKLSFLFSLCPISHPDKQHHFLFLWCRVVFVVLGKS